MPFAATWMDLEMIILSEVQVRKRKTNTICYHLYMESKVWNKWACLWSENRLTDIENRLVVAWGRWSGGVKDWEFGAGRCKLLHIRWVNNKSYCIAQELHWISCDKLKHNGKDHGEEGMYIYNWVTLLNSRI